MQIYDFIESFKSTNFYEQINFNRFKNINEGYLFLNLVENNNTKKKLDKMLVEDKEYFILGWTFITPLANSLVCKPRVSGIMLDTTWTLLQIIKSCYSWIHSCLTKTKLCLDENI